ncbi:MAG: endonuclease/exonuclease/phosphatase family protein [Alistipes sp.]
MKRLIFIFAWLSLAACSSATELNVMTFNIRLDTSDDGVNQWSNRRERAAKVITLHDIDIFGTQEVLANQLNDLKQRLPDYQAVGVGREDGATKGEYSAVFFKKERFTALSSGTFWLSETPEIAGSKGWDGACERVATWVILRDRSGVEVLFINTHLDHVGQIARREGVALIIERIKTLREGRAVILTGDFNATPDSEVITHVIESGTLLDSKALASKIAGTSWSFSDFGEIPEARRPLLDYIFVSKDICVQRYEVLPQLLDGGYLSDHAPIMATLKLKKIK